MSYSSEVLADSPAAYYRMDEASGLIQDSSGNANHATSTEGVGSATYAQTGAIASDIASKSILFNPQFVFIVPDAATLDLLDTFTIEMWWRFDTAGIAQWPLSKQLAAYEIRVGTDNKFSLVKAGTSLTVTSTSAIPNDAAFHHIVVTKTGATVKLYLDGADVTGTVSNSTYANNALALRIGGEAGNNADAYLDEIALYPTALSAARVSDHFNAASLVPVPTLRTVQSNLRW